ncbi:hypothetical protein MUO66_02230, partial [Candidatus Bathyarchaeota archaeon]|nr:hypothetical protein [Candidatus Bathyarchaeota archaeon]
MQAERINQQKSAEDLFFDVNAKLEEISKSSNQVELLFKIDITTKPSIVKYSTSGQVIIEGKQQDIKKKLEINPKTKIPQI